MLGSTWSYTLAFTYKGDGIYPLMLRAAVLSRSPVLSCAAVVVLSRSLVLYRSLVLS
jgi:hypothetical protein